MEFTQTITVLIVIYALCLVVYATGFNFVKNTTLYSEVGGVVFIIAGLGIAYYYYINQNTNNKNTFTNGEDEKKQS